MTRDEALAKACEIHESMADACNTKRVCDLCAKARVAIADLLMAVDAAARADEREKVVVMRTMTERAEKAEAERDEAQHWRERHCREAELYGHQSQANWERARRAEAALEAAERERDEWKATAEERRVALDHVSGALLDSGVVVHENRVDGYALSIRGLTVQRDKLKLSVDAARETMFLFSRRLGESNRTAGRIGTMLGRERKRALAAERERDELREKLAAAVSDPMTRTAAIERLRAMHDDVNLDLSWEDRVALRHALAMAHDVEVLRVEVTRIRGAFLEYAQHAEDSGWFALAREIRRRATEGT